MTYPKIILLLFICLCTSWTPVSAGEKVTVSIRQLHSDPIALAVRRTFDAYRKNPSINQYVSKINGLAHYFPRFQEKFIVLAIDEGGFGGYFVTIIVSPKKMSVWRFWLYATDENEYQIRQITSIPFNVQEMKEFNVLRSKRYQKYWL